MGPTAANQSPQQTLIPLLNPAQNSNEFPVHTLGNRTEPAEKHSKKPLK